MMNYFIKPNTGSLFSAVKMNSNGLVMDSCHAHAEFELLFIEEGTSVIENSTQMTTVIGPAIIIHSPYTLHRANASGYYSRYILYITRETLRRTASYGIPFNEVSNFAVIRLNANECAVLKAYFNRMIERNSDLQLREMLFMIIMYELFTFRSADNTEEYSAERAYITDVRSYIGENFDASLTLDSLADRFFVSRAKLVADFKQTTGTTVKNYITLIRIGNARAMLHSGAGVSEAAAACGYNSESNFILAFRKSTGMSPGEYAKQRSRFADELSEHPKEFYHLKTPD